jgi:hypothetical protein
MAGKGGLTAFYVKVRYSPKRLGIISSVHKKGGGKKEVAIKIFIVPLPL